MLSQQLLVKEYLKLDEKHKKQGLSEREIIIKHTIGWVLGYARLNPIDFINRINLVDLRKE